MRNVQFSIEENRLVIVIDLNKDYGLSKSGRSKIVASTEGNLTLFDSSGFREEILNLNLTKKLRTDEDTAQ